MASLCRTAAGLLLASLSLLLVLVHAAQPKLSPQKLCAEFGAISWHCAPCCLFHGMEVRKSFMRASSKACRCKPRNKNHREAS